MITLWVVLFIFCLLIFSKYFKRPPRKNIFRKVWHRLKFSLKVIWPFIAFMLGAPLLLTAPFWFIVYILTGFDFSKFWINQIAPE